MYNHFEGNGGRLPAGHSIATGGKCPLYDDQSNKRKDQQVEAAEKEAMLKVRAEHPELSEEDLKIKFAGSVQNNSVRARHRHGRHPYGYQMPIFEQGFPGVGRPPWAIIDHMPNAMPGAFPLGDGMVNGEQPRQMPQQNIAAQQAHAQAQQQMQQRLFQVRQQQHRMQQQIEQLRHQRAARFIQLDQAFNDRNQARNPQNPGENRGGLYGAGGGLYDHVQFVGDDPIGLHPEPLPPLDPLVDRGRPDIHQQHVQGQPPYEAHAAMAAGGRPEYERLAWARGERRRHLHQQRPRYQPRRDPLDINLDNPWV